VIGRREELDGDGVGDLGVSGGAKEEQRAECQENQASKRTRGDIVHDWRPVGRLTATMTRTSDRATPKDSNNGARWGVGAAEQKMLAFVAFAGARRGRPTGAARRQTVCALTVSSIGIDG
jgi:hypothetical protein